jgi:predicted enzyme related to lactoylglutathione lyase
MTSRTEAPTGAACWTDLWTSDVEGSRAFYSRLFGWEAMEPSPEFGGYFMFHRDGVPVAGGMGDMGPEMPANNTWKIYLSTPDITKTVELARSAGADVAFPPEPVADLGIQAVLADPTGATVGAWQPGTFPGFTVLDEPGAPTWFELHTRDHGAAVDFYRSVFGWETQSVSDTDEFRYTTQRHPDADQDLAGIMDARNFLPEGQGSFWAVYWTVDDAEATQARVEELGGSVVMGVHDTPYGRLVVVADPAGAEFRLRQLP